METLEKRTSYPNRKSPREEPQKEELQGKFLGKLPRNSTKEILKRKRHGKRPPAIEGENTKRLGENPLRIFLKPTVLVGQRRAGTTASGARTATEAKRSAKCEVSKGGSQGIKFKPISVVSY